MAEIKTFNLSHLQQNESFGFHGFALAEFEKCQEPKFTELLNDYKAEYNAFDGTLKTSGGEDVRSKEITRLDQARDNAYRGLCKQNDVAMDDFDPEIAEIARRVDIILRRYGNPCSLPYLAENGAIQNIVQELEEFDNPQAGGEEDRPGELSDGNTSDLDGISLEGVYNRLKKAGLDRWVIRLKEANEKFIAVFTERNTHQATIVTGATKAARLKADAAYRAAVKRLNAMAEVNGDADYLEIINNINQLIDRQKTILATRKTNNAKKGEEGGSSKPDDERPGEL